MARELKPVDNTPICDPAYMRQIDPIWMSGTVPRRFWEDIAHRRDYLLWLCGKFGFRIMADFYRLCLSECYGAHGGRGLRAYWRTSALAAVQDCFPEYDWKPWLFLMVPQGFWDSEANRRDYMVWLGEELGFRRPEQWYRIEAGDIRSRCGETLLHRYTSFYSLMREFLPQLDWDRLDPHRSIRVEEILIWADAHHSRHGTWPTITSGEIPETGGDWAALNACLRDGLRGLPGGITLARFLQEHRSVPVGKAPPRLSEAQILAWADATFAAQGKWPTEDSGPISNTKETWGAVSNSLRMGNRGLRGGSSLAQLLVNMRGARDFRNPPPLSEEQILTWADAWFAAEGKWPKRGSGQLPGTDENWAALDTALSHGVRGLPGGTSLANLLSKQRGTRNHLRLPPLSEEQILAWADAYFAENGKWPITRSGPIPGSKEHWGTVDRALRAGSRGLSCRSSLAQLLAKRRGVHNIQRLPPLSEKLILGWVDAWSAEKGELPTHKSGAIPDTRETWSSINAALTVGCRSLPGGSSLRQLLFERRGARNPKRQPLSEGKIVAWAHRYFLANSRWPSANSEPIPQSPNDTWQIIDTALRNGNRGLSGGSSLTKLLQARGLK